MILKIYYILLEIICIQDKNFHWYITSSWVYLNVIILKQLGFKGFTQNK